MKRSYLLTLLIMGSQSSQYAEALKMHEEGIFDRYMAKVSEKERVEAEFDIFHQKNLAKAEQQAAIIASGQVDQNLVGSPTVDDQVENNLDQLSSMPLKQLAGGEQKKTNVMAQSLVQAKLLENQQKAVEEQDADRDDFEGFGSITAMAQHKDVLVERKLNDTAFQAKLEADEKAKKEAEEKVKKDAEEKVKADKLKDAKAQLSQTKAKMEAALKKTAAPKPAAKVEVKTAPAVQAPAKPAAAQSIAQESSEESISSGAYQRAMSQVEEPYKPKIAVKSIALPQAVSDDGEEVGFLGKHAMKLDAKEKLEQAQIAVLGTSDPDSIQVPLSDEAPKHKGMLARAMEKELKAKHEAEIAEKNQLMAEAMSDPVFKSQLETLKTQTAIKKNNSLI